MCRFLIPAPVFVLALFLVMGPVVPSADATTSEVVVANPTTGVALDGFDPVAYFTEREAKKGSEAFEIQWMHAYWHFTNPANKERFEEAPHIYAPIYNGYGAYAVSKGFLAEGNPYIWAIYRDRLYLFHSYEARAAWANDPENRVSDAARHWENMLPRLTR